MGEGDERVEHMISGRKNDRWMRHKEFLKRKINNYYPPNLVTLEPDHVNAVRGLRESEVIEKCKDMMIRSLLDINTSGYTLMKY